MDNGVKAVFIAVSVCVTIAVFTFVATIYKNNVVLTEKGALTLEAEVINVHNSQFSTYLGRKLSLSEARILINKIYNSNEKNIAIKQEDLLVKLYIKNGAHYEDEEEIISKVQNETNKQYLSLRKYITNPSRLLGNYIETLNTSLFEVNMSKLKRNLDEAIIEIYLDPVI